jgi:hypothetical protein
VTGVRQLLSLVLTAIVAFSAGLVFAEQAPLDAAGRPPAASSAHVAPVGPDAPAAPYCAERVYDRLFFGLATPNGTVSDQAWSRFLRKVVTPRFAGGLTVVDAHGQWRAEGDRKVTVEPARVVEIAHEDSPDMDRAVDEIIEIYKRSHQQRSVMRTRARVQVCL